ncbi:3-deoxy-D-manno-octulosonic acid transferase [Lacinutrix iliipiscaria]|uniref:3-deoxy-D-manno-octulosonic acid transferase n=1 Tax=Lacinutrix iliipiscaria TaxID=1230532 RepID=A0ABW5WHP6_9FLAO
MNNLLNDSHVFNLKEMYFSNKEMILRFIYNIIINITPFILKGVAYFNPKVKKGVLGRSQTFKTLKTNISKTDQTIWFHCASLGEYEQGLPVFKEIRKLYTNHKIVLSFFSPSGYEIRKHSKIADVIIYLPLDTNKNAIKFLDLVNPELSVFVKYDIWPNFLNELKHRNKKAILISALFRSSQPFFKSYGKHLREALFTFEHIFVQNETSKNLLNKINYTKVTISGDTRFDRVYSQLEINNTLEFIETFKQDSLCIVAGSTWPEDENILIDYINKYASDDLKFIIAPHNINVSQIGKFKKQLKVNSILFSEKEHKNLAEYKVFIIDTIGLLSKIYNYANIAYVGGAMGHTGLHNTLEPAVFGIPIIIGQNFKNFPEASEMMKNQGLFSIRNKKEIESILNRLISNTEERYAAGLSNFEYIKKNKGSVIQIMDFLRI